VDDVMNVISYMTRIKKVIRDNKRKKFSIIYCCTLLQRMPRISAKFKRPWKKSCSLRAIFHDFTWTREIIIII
jgi:hypothetical protein